MINILIEDLNGNHAPLQLQQGDYPNLMEALKALGYPILGNCGGIALCATCQVHILKGANQITPPADPELNMLDTLPEVTANTRLACQIDIDEKLAGAIIRIKDEDF